VAFLKKGLKKLYNCAFVHVYGHSPLTLAVICTIQCVCNMYWLLVLSGLTTQNSALDKGLARFAKYVKPTPPNPLHTLTLEELDVQNYLKVSALFCAFLDCYQTRYASLELMCRIIN